MGFFERNRAVAAREARLSAADRLPPGQYFTERYPVLHVGDVPTVDPSTWTLRLFGLVRARAHADVGRARTRCPSAEVVDRHPLRDEVVEVRHARGAACASATSSRSSSIDAVGDARAAARGVRLHDEHAARRPARRRRAARRGSSTASRSRPSTAVRCGMVLPARVLLEVARSGCAALEFLDHDQPGFWEQNGYHNDGDPWREQRYWGD